MKIVQPIDNYRCSCKERLVFKEAGGVLLKSRLVKIVGSDIEMKCKRCGAWVSIPRAALSGSS